MTAKHILRGGTHDGEEKEFEDARYRKLIAVAVGERLANLRANAANPEIYQFTGEQDDRGRYIMDLVIGDVNE